MGKEEVTNSNKQKDKETKRQKEKRKGAPLRLLGVSLISAVLRPGALVRLQLSHCGGWVSRPPRNIEP